jgi:membrane protein
VPGVPLDVRGRIDRVAERVPPLAYVLRILDRYNDLHGNVSANSITLTAFLALFAISLLAVAAIGYLDATDVDVATAITKWLGLSGDAANVVTSAVNTARDSARFATLVGFLGVVTIGTSFAGAIATAYNVAWGVRNRGLVERLRGVVWLAGFLVLGAASVMATTLWTRLPKELSPLVVVVTVATNAVLWAFTSWWLPNRPITLRAMLPGVVAGATMLEALKVLGGILVPRLVSNASELWGAIGAVFALIAWILFFGRVVVYVTVVEVVEAERRGLKDPHPEYLP